MTDSATSNKRLRKQSLGSNTNTWGETKLNEVLDAIDQCMDGYESIALTADLTLTTTNYTTADQAKYRVVNFTGSAGAVAVTFPSVQGWYLILNNNSGVVTCKCAAGTGVAIPAGYIALIYGNGTDMANGAPMLIPGAMTVAGQIHGLTAGTAATDAVNKTQMETAIATAGLPATSGTILNSSNDAAAGYNTAKNTAKSGAGLAQSTLNSGANEQNQFALDLTSLTVETAPADADLGALYDASATAHRKMTLQNLLLVGWAVAAAVDPSADYVLIYDASAGVLGKTLVSTIADSGQIALYDSIFSL